MLPGSGGGGGDPHRHRPALGGAAAQGQGHQRQAGTRQTEVSWALTVRLMPGIGRTGKYAWLGYAFAMFS